jgi:hypothetical protein
MQSLRLSSRAARLLAPAARRAVHFRGAPPALPQQQESSSPAVSIDGFTVTSPHRRHTRASAPGTLDAKDYTLPHAIYTPDETTALRTDVHYVRVLCRSARARSLPNLSRPSNHLSLSYCSRPRTSATARRSRPSRSCAASSTPPRATSRAP